MDELRTVCSLYNNYTLKNYSLTLERHFSLLMSKTILYVYLLNFTFAFGISAKTFIVINFKKMICCVIPSHWYVVLSAYIKCILSEIGKRRIDGEAFSG